MSQVLHIAGETYVDYFKIYILCRYLQIYVLCGYLKIYVLCQLFEDLCTMQIFEEQQENMYQWERITRMLHDQPAEILGDDDDNEYGGNDDDDDRLCRVTHK